MPQLGKPFSPIEVGEIRTLSIGFGPSTWSVAEQGRTSAVFLPQLGPGVTIASVVWGCAAYANADPDAADRITELDPTTTIAFVTFDASDAVAGATYVVEATATTSDGQTLRAWTTILCVASPVPASPPATPLSFDFTSPNNLVI